MNRFRICNVLGLAFAIAALVSLNGCDETISSSRETEVKDDGTVKTEEKTVTRESDGTITETEKEEKTTKP